MNVVTSASWLAVKRMFPDAIHLPFRGPIDCSGGRLICDINDINYRNSGNNENNGNMSAKDREKERQREGENAWLCHDCVNEKQEGAEECISQKASRILEVSDPILLALYNATRGRRRNRSRGVLKAAKKAIGEIGDEESVDSSNRYRKHILHLISSDAQYS